MIKNIFFVLSILIPSVIFSSCKDDNESDMIWDYYPVVFEIRVENNKKENLLDENVVGNILDTEMYMIFQGERYEVNKGWPEGSFFPFPSTKVYMPVWYGAFIAPYFFDNSQFEEVPERGNRLYIGEFFGDSTGETSLELYLNGKSFWVSYINKIVKPGQVDRHFYLNDQEIPSSTFTLTL